MPEIQWYYARNDQQFGPVSAAELKQLADEGRLAPDDLLWREGMDQWATAINLRGLFTNDATGGPQPTIIPPGAPPEQAAPPVVKPPPAPGQGVSLRSVLRTTQIMLWSMCVLVVLAGVVLFTRAFLIAEDSSEEAAAAAVFAAFFIAAYVLARSGEKLARLLLGRGGRRS
jgi:hypothetical protein